MRIAFETAEMSATKFGISPDELAKVKPLYDAFMHLQALCANPETATRAYRDARGEAWRVLEKHWRVFLNREIRLNGLMSVADKEVFGILPRDVTRTPPGEPKGMAQVTVVRMGERQFDVVVAEVATGKRRRPDDAAYSVIYSAIAGAGDPAPPREAFRYMGFSPKYRHAVTFAETEIARRAWIYARYSNRRGQEGPEGPLSSFIIG
jgi:hypothetical protein